MMSALFGSSFAFSGDIALLSLFVREIDWHPRNPVALHRVSRGRSSTISETGLTRTQAHYGYLWWVSAPDSALPQNFSAFGYRWFAVKTSTPTGMPSQLTIEKRRCIGPQLSDGWLSCQRARSLGRDETRRAAENP
jgi:hypothetical protein